jgi:hypothetical protein
VLAVRVVNIQLSLSVLSIQTELNLLLHLFGQHMQIGVVLARAVPILAAVAVALVALALTGPVIDRVVMADPE